MTKFKKVIFIIPLLLIFIISALIFAACENNNINDDKNAIFVENLTQLNNAILTSSEQQIIKLNNNISMEKDGENIMPVLVFPKENNIDATIDLNGYNLNTYVRIASKHNNETTENTVNLTIKNSKHKNGFIGFDNNEYYYGLVIVSNNQYNINLHNVDFKAQYGGIYTNGTYNGKTTLNAEKCSFVSTHSNTITNSKDGGVGAYLASKNFTYNFKDCYFEGYTAYFTKHGTHKIENCKFNATGLTAYEPAYYGNGGSVTGSALVIESASDYKLLSGNERELIVNINGGEFTSISNYAIEEFSTAKSGDNEVCYAEIIIKRNPALNGQGNKIIYTENNLID